MGVVHNHLVQPITQEFGITVQMLFPFKMMQGGCEDSIGPFKLFTIHGWR